MNVSNSPDKLSYMGSINSNTKENNRTEFRESSDESRRNYSKDSHRNGAKIGVSNGT